MECVETQAVSKLPMIKISANNLHAGQRFIPQFLFTTGRMARVYDGRHRKSRVRSLESQVERQGTQD
jgi:hypothetical protein